MARRGSPEWKARVGEGAARGRRAGARRRMLDRLTAGALQQFMHDGHVHPSVQPFLDVRRELACALLDDLGDVTAAQRALVDGVLKASVASDVLFAMFLQSGDPKKLEGLGSLLAAIRSNVALLGLQRVPRELPIDLDAYLEQRGRRALDVEVKS